MSSRRTLLKLIGGGTVLAATGLSGYVMTQGPSMSARTPWRTAGLYDDPRKRALSYAILAPNPHNMQPWQVKLTGTTDLEIYCDLDRLLPETDPFGRQIVIGFGTFLEHLKLAAAEEGFGLEITPFPEGEDMKALDERPIAVVHFKQNTAQPVALFQSILDRRTNRNTYIAKDVEADLLNAIVKASQSSGVTARTTGNTEIAEKLRDLTWKGHVVEMHTTDALMETVKVMRIGRSEVAEQPNGLAFDSSLMSAMKLAGLMSREAMADPKSKAFLEGMKMFQERAKSARAFGWLLNRNETRADQLNAGMAYARLNLKATQLGLAIHPWSQTLQEYEEMKALYGEVHDLIGEGQTVQMLVRIGYASDVIAAPRQKLETYIV